MPIYEYRCANCGFQDEYLQKVSEAPLKLCPSCGKKKLEKLLSAPGFQLKGSGWYATDFKGGSKPVTAQADTGAKPEATGESKAQSKAESKPAPQAETKAETKPAAKAAKATASSTSN